MALLFGDDRATKADLTFLRVTKVGQMVSIQPRGGEEEEEGGEENSGATRVEVKGRGGQGPAPDIVKGRSWRRGPPPGRKVGFFCAIAFCSGVMGTRKTGCPSGRGQEGVAEKGDKRQQPP